MDGERTTLGLVEDILVFSNGDKEEAKARIDTGATASSIDVNLASKLNLGPITRSKLVKSASGVKRRPIIKVRVKIGGIELEGEFTLADRKHMTYSVLIGQNILKKGNFLIDPNSEKQ